MWQWVWSHQGGGAGVSQWSEGHHLCWAVFPVGREGEREGGRGVREEGRETPREGRGGATYMYNVLKMVHNNYDAGPCIV